MPRRAGLPGVVDKDRCSAELALAVGADLLILLTGVPRVAIDYGTRWERELERITRLGRRARAGRGRVPGRQHGPEDRVGAALRRGRRPRRDHHAGHLRAAVDGDDGTWVVPDEEAVSA